MDIGKLEIFLDSIKTGSFSQTAEKFSYTPSALSHIADSVEQELGVKIIERNYKGITLTSEGQTILPYIEALINSSKQVYSVAKQIGAKKSELVIGSYSSISKYILPKIIKGIKEKYPEINISISICNSVSEMQQCNADLYFVSEVEKNVLEKLSFLPLYNDKYCIIAPIGLKFNKSTIKLQDLSNVSVFVNEYKLVNQYIDKTNCEKILVNSTDDDSIISMVKNGLGISILPSLSVDGKIKGIKKYNIDPPLTRRLGVLYDENSKNKNIKKLVRYIIENNDNK